MLTVIIRISAPRVGIGFGFFGSGRVGFGSGSGSVSRFRFGFGSGSGSGLGWAQIETGLPQEVQTSYSAYIPLPTVVLVSDNALSLFS